LIGQLDAGRAFDTATAIETGISVRGFGTASISWLEDLRQTTSIAVDYQSTLLSHASDALSNASGVNVDDEYAKQLQLEQSYAASSKLIAIINQIFDSLLAAVD
jgi:flagellar hook-associated protein 1 FlgK